MSDIKPPKPPPITPPHPADRLSREELEQAIALGITPLVVEEGGLRALTSPQQHLARMLAGYRYHLRSAIAGMDWEQACSLCRSKPEGSELHTGNLLMWGYMALCAERDAAEQYTEMAAAFRDAATAANELAFALRQDARHLQGIPLQVVRARHASLYGRHVKTFGVAFRERKKIATRVLRDRCATWFDWLTQKGIFVANPDGKNSQYNTDRASFDDIAEIANRLSTARELAVAIVDYGVAGVLRSRRKGSDGRWPVLFDAWLVQQGRECAPKLGPKKLAALLIKHNLADEDDGVELIAERLKKAGARHREPVRLQLF